MDRIEKMLREDLQLVMDENGYEFKVLVPGCKKEDLKIELTGDDLIVMIAKAEDNPFVTDCIIPLFVYSRVSKKNISSHLERGILTVVLPYKETKVIDIE